MKQRKFNRRDLIKSFGPLAFVLLPVARSMGYVAGGTFEGAPRYVMFFRGASFHSPTVHEIASINALSGPLAPLQEHSGNLILFKNMSIQGGSPKTDGYKEEHAGGLMGCVTGNSYHYYDSDSYMAYTDHESFDVMLANHYQSRPELSELPFPSLHIGAGAQSDCDSCGLGQRYISYRQRQAGDDYYSNAIEPIQNSAQVYESLMERIELICSDESNQAPKDNTELRAALERQKSLLDFRMQDISAAKQRFGIDSEHARKLDGLLEGWRQVEKTTTAQLASLDSGATSSQTCPSAATPDGNGTRTNDCDELSPVHDQMIDLIQLAFSWDLTRVVAFTLSGASSGHRWRSQGVSEAHHSLEHGGDVDGLNTMGSYFSGKFARLLTALENVDDGSGQTALDNSAVLLGMECWSDGGHYMRDIPFILAGRAAGRFETGRIVQADGRSNNDIYISIQQAAGINSDVFGLPSLCQGPIV